MTGTPKQLILVAVESRQAGAGEPVVLVNPTGGYKIGRGDRAFVLAETQVRAVEYAVYHPPLLKTLLWVVMAPRLMSSWPHFGISSSERGHVMKDS